MNSVAGQVQKQKFSEKIYDYITKLKKEKEERLCLDAFVSQLFSAKSELDSIRKNLDLITDADSKEYFIYRLKAAELNFNRYVKLAKEKKLALSPFEEANI